MAVKFLIQLETIKQIAPQARHFGFRIVDQEYFSFKPGQFISLHIPTASKEVRRNYSLANINNYANSNIIELGCAYVPGGIASELLFNLEIGAMITASGPYGNFVLPEQDPNRYILVATGAGVVPYRSMIGLLQKKLANNLALKVVLLFGARCLAEALYRQDFINLAQQCQNFKYLISYSREMPLQPEIFEYSGHVQDSFKDLAIEVGHDHFYLCGNPNMIDGAFAALQALGVDRQQIHREKYILSK